VTALASELGLTADELLEDLDLLTMVGRPPFQPDDYIDIYVDGDRVYVDLDQRFSAPPRLTASEAAALAAAAELLRPATDELSSALAKLEKVIPTAARDRYREIGQKLDVAAVAPAEVAPITRAIVEHREVELEYFSGGRGQTERRTVRPHELFSHRGVWYLSAFCCTRQDERLFRLDRIKQLSLTDRRYAPGTTEPRASVPSPANARGEVRVRFTPAAAPYLRERFGDDVRALADGSVEVQVAGDSERWLTQWVLSFGGDACVIEPEWARLAVADAARASLKS
jgi:proteasome accessory factor C